MTTSTLDSLTELTSSVKTDIVLVQDDPEGTPEDKYEEIDNLLKTPATYNDFDEASAPATPSGSDVRIYAKTDGKMYSKDDAGTETLMSGGLGTGSNQLFEGRITPTTGVPIETADQASITELYITPYEGDQVRIYDGSANWDIYTFSEITVNVTNTKTGCAYTSGSAVIINISDTSDLLVGQVASGTGIPAGAVISTIDSTTQVTLDQNTTSTVPGGSVDFLMPADTNIDIFLYNDSGTIKHNEVMWTDATTRSTALTTQDSIDVSAINPSYLYIGTYRTSGTDGETTFSNAGKARLIWNRYNQVKVPLLMTQATTYTLSSTTYIEENGSGNARVNLCIGKTQFISARSSGACSNNNIGNSYIVDVGIDTTSTGSANILHPGYVATSSSGNWASTGEAIYNGYIAEGYHYIVDIAKYSYTAGDSSVTVLRPSLEIQSGFLC